MKHASEMTEQEYKTALDNINLYDSPDGPKGFLSGLSGKHTRDMSKEELAAWDEVSKSGVTPLHNSTGAFK